MQDLKKIIGRSLTAADVPVATAIERNIPIYDCTTVATALDDASQRTALKAEIAENLLHGSGIFVLRRAYHDTDVVDRATEIFKQIIVRERQTKAGGADHFAAAGANDRIWNSLEKLCRADPQVFVDYHSNRWIELASEAWLGPGFQVTAQVNLVRPGGKAQEAHCDYHLGFMTQEEVNSYPAHVHALSAQLTLQGAVAHCDMPVESGTTKLLPFSQTWAKNYSSYREPATRELFEENHVQLPLEKGDLLFFSPGLLHAAGDNVTSDIERLANLLQISSAMGISLEAINRVDLCKNIFPVLLNSSLSLAEKHAAIASSGDGYAFPTNLDTDPPIGGLAPKTQQQLMRDSLDAGLSPREFEAALDEREARRKP